MQMGWFHNAKLKRRADEAFDEGDQITFNMGDLSRVTVHDLHKRIIHLVTDYFSTETECSIEKDKFALGRIYAHAAEAAARLYYSGDTAVRIRIPFLTADRTGPKHLDVMVVHWNPDA